MSILCVSDLDGTLLSDSGVITAMTLTSVARFIARGNYFGIATSRSRQKAKSMTKGLEINFPSVYLNGAVIEYPDGTLIKEIINPTTAEELLSYASEEYALYPFVLGCDSEGRDQLGHYVNDDPAYAAFLEARKSDPRLRLLEDRVDLDEILLINYLVDCRACKEFSQDIRGLLGASYAVSVTTDIHIGGYANVEITHNLASKGTALRGCISGFKSAVSASYAIGDQENDISLFDYVDYAVCPENANSRVMEKADIIIGSNCSEGVAQFLEQLK